MGLRARLPWEQNEGASEWHGGHCGDLGLSVRLRFNAADLSRQGSWWPSGLAVAVRARGGCQSSRWPGASSLSSDTIAHLEVEQTLNL